MIESGYFMNAIRRDIEMVKGDTLSFGFEVKGLHGQRPDAVQFSCKDKLEDLGYIFSVSLADTIDFRSYDAETDILTYGVRVPPNKTAGIYAGAYFYDLELRVNGDVITLMIGRLQIDEQITNSAVAPSPSYEDGDNVLYPIQDIPEGRKKAYSEQAVSDIAQELEGITGVSLGYKLPDMPDALETIRLDVEAINEATKTLTDSSEDYSIGELAPAIASVEKADSVYYPISEPEGTKVYKENNISEIGQAIQSLVGTTNKFRTKDMRSAISSVIPIRTKSGAVVSIVDGGIDMYYRGKIYVSPVQSGEGTPAPDNVRPISGFTGSTFKQVGKNLVNIEAFILSAPNDRTKGIEFDTPIPAGSYTLSFNIAENSASYTTTLVIRDKSGASYTNISTDYINSGTTGAKTVSFTASVPFSYIYFYMSSSDTIGSVSLDSFMLEVGSSASEYVPYTEKSVVSVSWEDEAGTIYVGYKDLSSGKVFATWKSVTYTGADTESWNKEDISGYPRYKIFVNDLKVTTSGRIEVLSNIGIYASGNAYGVIFGYQNQQLQKMIYYYSPSDITTVDAFKTWLGTHNLQVLYPIEPIEYNGDPITGLTTMLGDNSFFNSTGDTEITYSADITKLIESLG